MRLFLLAALALILASCNNEPPASSAFPVALAVQSVPFEGPTGSGEIAPTLEGPARPVALSPSGPMRFLPPGMTVSVTFSTAMVPLTPGGLEAPGAIELDPAWPGTTRWTGTRTLVFSPTEPFPIATSFQVWVDPDLLDAEGRPLSAAVAWRFETPRPRLIGSTPESGNYQVRPDAPLFVRFSESVDASRAAPFVSLRVRDGGEVAFDLAAAGDSALVIRPATPLTKDTGYELAIREGLPAAGAPLGTADTESVLFRTHGAFTWETISQPLPWWQEETKQFKPDRGITLAFSTPVKFSALIAALSIEPPVEWPSALNDRTDYESTTHSLPAVWTPNTSYRVLLTGLSDIFGQPLGPGLRTFRTGAMEPAFAMPQGVLFIESNQQQGIPAQVTNLGSVRIGVEPITDAAHLVSRIRAYDPYRWYGDLPEGTPEPVAIEASTPLPLGVSADRPTYTLVDLAGHLPDGTGIVGVHIESPTGTQGSKGPSQFKALAVVTNLGVTAKFAPHEGLVLVTRLSDASPVEAAEVTVLDAQGTVLWKGATDATGRSEMPGWAALGQESASRWDKPTQFVVVRSGTDWSFAASTLSEGLEPYRFGIPYAWYPEPEPTAGSVFSDRGLYRAGDRINLKGVLRRRTSGDWSPIRDSVRVFIESPRDERVLDRSFAPGALGTIDLFWNAPRDAALGSYAVRLALAADTAAATRESWEGGDIASGTFRVEAFRTATFAVEASSPRTSYVAGDLFEGRIDARYLFGAPLGNAPIRVELSTQGTYFTPPGLDGFRFDASWDWSRDGGNLYRTLVATDTLTDARGGLSRTARLPGNDRGAVTMLTWEAQVESPDFQELSARKQVLLHPATFYVGLRPSTGYLDASNDGRMQVDVISVDPEGRSVGPHSIALTLVRREWNSVREIGTDGRTRWRSEVIETVMASDSVTTRVGRMSRMEFEVNQGGLYVINARGFDERGNLVRSEASFYASGSGYVGWERNDDDRLELVADRQTYAPGQTARIMIQSPFEEARALVTVERDGVMDSFVQTVTGSAPEITIPIEERHLPNVFVGVILLSGRTSLPAAGGDVGAPAFRAGYVQLSVDPGSRHLRVLVSASADTLRPGDRISVDLRLLDASGNGTPGEIAFSAADAGVIDLIGYRLPDPFGAFYSNRPLKVTTSETRANLVRQRSFGEKEEDLGGGGGDPDSQLRRDFRPLAHWDPSIQTDRSGRATIEFMLPESLTLFRLMAVGIAEGNRFGQGESTVVTSQPLVIQPALPRFARAGDTFEASALVTNRTGAGGNASVSISADGFDLQGAAASEQVVGAGETSRVAFSGMAGAGDSLSFSFSASLGEERDGFALSIPIIPTATRIRNGQFTSTGGRLELPFAYPGATLPDRGGLSVAVSSTALVGLEGAVDYLFEYPYGCLEQTTSRIRPLIVAGPLLDAFGLEALGGQREALIAEWMDGLDAFWTGSGYSLWPGSVTNHPYVTAYVLNTLTDAVQFGVGVRRSDLDRVAAAVERTVRQASNRPSWLPATAWNDTRAFMLLGLARSGRVLESEIATLAETMLSDGGTSTDGLSLMARTVHAASAPSLDRFKAPLSAAVRSRIRVEAEDAYAISPSDPAYAWIFASETRSTAMALSAIAVAPDAPDDRELAEGLVRRLLAERTTGHWATTQDNAAVVDALLGYRDAFETVDPDFDVRVTIAGRSLLEKAFRGPSLTSESASLSPAEVPAEGKLSIDVTGTGRAYTTLLVDAWTTSPMPAASSGLVVSRTFQPLSSGGEPLGGERSGTSGEVALEGGDQILVTLRIVSPSDRNYIVVDDALPAGLEPVNTAFQTSDDSVGELTGSDRWWGSFNHTEMRDDRVLLFADYLVAGEHVYRYAARATSAGTFRWPAVQAEAMYRPSVYGRTSGATLRVTAQPEDLTSK